MTGVVNELALRNPQMVSLSFLTKYLAMFRKLSRNYQLKEEQSKELLKMFYEKLAEVDKKVIFDPTTVENMLAIQ